MPNDELSSGNDSQFEVLDDRRDDAFVLLALERDIPVLDDVLKNKALDVLAERVGEVFNDELLAHTLEIVVKDIIEVDNSVLQVARKLVLVAPLDDTVDLVGVL